VGQSPQAIAELAEICSTEANFTTSQHSRPIIAMKQDAMTGGYLLTYGDVKIDKATFFDCLMCFDDFDVMGKYDHIREVYKWKGIEEEVAEKLEDERRELLKKKDGLTYKKDLLKNKLKKAKKEEKENIREQIDNVTEKMDEIQSRIDKLNDEFDVILEEELMYNGRTLFSFLLPDNFEYNLQNNMDKDGKPVHITRGVMISGTLNKAVIGSASGSISHMIRLNYSARRAIEFVSLYQMIINRWLLTRGFSVGIEDCIPKKSDFIKQETNKCFSQALLHIQTEEDEELRELKVNNSLNNARDIGQRIAKESLSPYNSFVAMIRSGAKGNDNNITQITSMLGQQNAEGKRMHLVFNQRALPHFQSNLEEIVSSKESSTKMLENLFASRGFVQSGFFKGLTPYEFFFHTVGGREGLIDTACKSVIYETEIVILEDGKTRVVKIGEWIDKLLSGDKEINYDNSENEERELVELDKEVFIPTSDLKGNVSWGKITAVTRHNPTETMYEIKTLGGRKVTVTDSHSLLVWNDKKSEFERVKPEFVSVGSYVPTTAKLVEPEHISNYFDVSSLLPKTEYIHGTDFLKAKTMLEKAMKENNNRSPNGWWGNHNGKDFILPYTKIQLFLRTLWRSNIECIKENCIYPYGASKSDAIVTDKFEFTYDNGVFLGLYIADGNSCDGYVAITKNDKDVRSFVEKWFDKYNINHNTTIKTNHIGGTSTVIRGYSTLMSSIISTLGGKGAQNKHIHDACLNAPLEFIKGLLCGIFSGDGWVTNNSIEMSTASRRLSDNVNMCLSRLGIFGKLSVVKIKNNNFTEQPLDSHRISVRAQWADLFKNNITLVSNSKQDKLNKLSSSVEHRNFQVQNDVVLDKIVSIEKVSIFHKKVYDLTVPSTLNFGLANGLHVVDTAQTGYIQRKMVKLLEDLQVTYKGTVEDAAKHVISFDYGGDNFDGSKIIYRGGDPLFIDVESVCNKLNADYEWEQHHKNKEDELEDEFTKLLQDKCNIEVLEDKQNEEEDDVDKITELFKKKCEVRDDEDENYGKIARDNGEKFEHIVCELLNETDNKVRDDFMKTFVKEYKDVHISKLKNAKFIVVPKDKVESIYDKKTTSKADIWMMVEDNKYPISIKMSNKGTQLQICSIENFVNYMRQNDSHPSEVVLRGLKKFCGIIKPSEDELSLFSRPESLKNKKRYWMNELTNTEQKEILDFFRTNKTKILKIIYCDGMCKKDEHKPRLFIMNNSYYTKTNDIKLMFYTFNELIKKTSVGNVCTTKENSLELSKFIGVQMKGSGVKGSSGYHSLQFKDRGNYM
jgi:intein/homing endonuclease